MNLPCSIAEKMTSAVQFFDLERMTNIEERFAGNGDDRRL
jgi:hypothetical protein